MVRALVQPNDTVLELGARFGDELRVGRSNRNTGFGLVEPDVDAVPPIAKQATAAMRLSHFAGRRRPTARRLLAVGFPTAAARNSCARRMSPQSTQRKIAARAFTQIESLIGGRRFNVALVDCEGCIDFSLSPELLQQLDFLLWEEDGHSVISNRRWYHRLTAYGFLLHWRIHDTFDPRRQGRGSVCIARG